MATVQIQMRKTSEYQRNRLAGKTRLRNNMLCVEWNDKLYSLIHSLTQVRKTHRQEVDAKNRAKMR